MHNIIEAIKKIHSLRNEEGIIEITTETLFPYLDTIRNKTQFLIDNKLIEKTGKKYLITLNNITDPNYDVILKLDNELYSYYLKILQNTFTYLSDKQIINDIPLLNLNHTYSWDVTNIHHVDDSLINIFVDGFNKILQTTPFKKIFDNDEFFGDAFNPYFNHGDRDMMLSSNLQEIHSILDTLKPRKDSFYELIKDCETYDCMKTKIDISQHQKLESLYVNYNNDINHIKYSQNTEILFPAFVKRINNLIDSKKMTIYKPQDDYQPTIAPAPISTTSNNISQSQSEDANFDEYMSNLEKNSTGYNLTIPRSGNLLVQRQAFKIINQKFPKMVKTGSGVLKTYRWLIILLLVLVILYIYNTDFHNFINKIINIYNVSTNKKNGMGK